MFCSVGLSACGDERVDADGHSLQCESETDVKSGHVCVDTQTDTNKASQLRRSLGEDDMDVDCAVDQDPADDEIFDFRSTDGFSPGSPSRKCDGVAPKCTSSGSSSLTTTLDGSCSVTQSVFSNGTLLSAKV